MFHATLASTVEPQQSKKSKADKKKQVAKEIHSYLINHQSIWVTSFDEEVFRDSVNCIYYIVAITVLEV